MAGFANGSILVANNVDFSGAYPPTNTVTSDGQLLIGSTAAPNIRVATLTQGSGIVITNGSGSISIATTGTPPTIWTTISASQTLAVNHGYICVSPGGALSLALPATSAVGDLIEVTLDGATSFTITQGAGQSIRIGNGSTTVGAGGSLASTQQGDTIRMVCSVVNLKWNILSEMGNLTRV